MALISAAVYTLAIVLDRALGEPPERVHPTVAVGKIAERLGFLRSYGVAGGFVLLILCCAVPVAVVYELLHNLPDFIKYPLAVYLLKTSFSWRGLRDFISPVGSAVLQGDIRLAKRLVGRVVSRDVDSLDAPKICSAAVESASENLHDSILSPLFYYTIFSCLSIEAGVSAALFFRWVNTLDAMYGYRDYGAFGTPAARLDDLLNFIPARIAAALILISARRISVEFLKWVGKTESPNAGYPMAAMASSLGVRLEKPGKYVIGRGGLPEPQHIQKALKIVDRAAILFALVMLLTLFACTPF